ncbi:NAD(P)/FAD-dependent oxidoreductase [Kribbella sandramycini]|uniref:Cation diffusion facilitator CzcD-associated flavoprotein CzcO n=1 Tax=Kribbella sandramycini TaxID=60450 RepID=A0A7Y4NYI6_9ACTN|nr:NAD(P)/FAD-dependent oxidoreductase [Kribbella sandramycini]MBB6568222.1 cation diffusion facilitator CzcD-associated flavoprotein CzcO [Kribbella sandramycini]NOL39185.1 NAD(P)/FAD-dependent oxidoreductase [Kribbella sandramycini]
MMDVVIIGAGASGLGAAIRLRQAGITDFAVLEKSQSLGGTWRDNTYPGCACDVPSALYSYSFAPNPSWTRAFAGQEEIRQYLADTASAYGVDPHLRFGVELLRADWSGSSWVLETSDGPLETRVLITATGPWHEPLMPAIPGSFDGPVFHSSRWDHSVSLAGKRVAVIGTGASAVQFIPELQPVVDSLHVFQRTAQWVLPKPDHYVPHLERWLFRRFPIAQRLLRGAEYLGMELLGLGFRHPRLMRVVEAAGRLHLRRSVPSATLRSVLTPAYTLGCKRILMSNTYYPALAAPNVAVHPTAVAAFDGSAVIGADGTKIEADAVIFGTGFKILDLPIAGLIHNHAGTSLAETWQGSPQAYLGTTVTGYPNLYNLLGPNLGTGHTSAFTILEAQLAHILTALTSHPDSILEVRPEPQAHFVTTTRAALRTTVYETGNCTSYYHDPTGQNSFNYPHSTPTLRRTLTTFTPTHYKITPTPPS